MCALIMRRPPGSTLTDTLSPYTTLCRSPEVALPPVQPAPPAPPAAPAPPAPPAPVAVPAVAVPPVALLPPASPAPPVPPVPPMPAVSPSPPLALAPPPLPVLSPDSAPSARPTEDRKRGVVGKSVSVSVDFGGRRILKKKKP